MRKNVLVLLGIACVLAVAFAGVFVFFPMQTGLSFTAPPVIFMLGENAGKPDVGQGNTITVSVGENATSCSILLHPTYQKTYYQNVTLVKNIESGAGAKAYNVWFKVLEPINFGVSGAQAKLIVYPAGAGRSGSPLLVVDLTSQGLSDRITLNANTFVELDVFIVYPEGVLLPSSQLTASMELVFSPQSEPVPEYP
ncbi:MAG: hypothetical protein QXY99_05305 [Thermoproteota archaeon]